MVEVSEKNMAFLSILGKISNGTMEVVAQKGEITLIRPATQRIDLNRPDELAAILSGDVKAPAIIDISAELGTAIVGEEIKEPQPSAPWHFMPVPMPKLEDPLMDAAAEVYKIGSLTDPVKKTPSGIDPLDEPAQVRPRSKG